MSGSARRPTGFLPALYQRRRLNIFSNQIRRRAWSGCSQPQSYRSSTASGMTGVRAIATAIFYVVYRFLEDYLLTPRIMARTVAVPGLVTVLATVVGGALLVTGREIGTYGVVVATVAGYFAYGRLPSPGPSPWRRRRARCPPRPSRVRPASRSAA